MKLGEKNRATAFLDAVAKDLFIQENHKGVLLRMYSDFMDEAGFLKVVKTSFFGFTGNSCESVKNLALKFFPEETLNDKWLPIDQAPKNRPILVKTISNAKYVVLWGSMSSDWLLAGSVGQDGQDGYRVIHSITHYQELPS